MHETSPPFPCYCIFTARSTAGQLPLAILCFRSFLIPNPGRLLAVNSLAHLPHAAHLQFFLNISDSFSKTNLNTWTPCGQNILRVTTPKEPGPALRAGIGGRVLSGCSARTTTADIITATAVGCIGMSSGEWSDDGELGYARWR